MQLLKIQRCSCVVAKFREITMILLKNGIAVTAVLEATGFSRTLLSAVNALISHAMIKNT